jgi:hypothetical protein
LVAAQKEYSGLDRQGGEEGGERHGGAVFLVLNLP